MKIVLGIETSCDDTSAALVREDGRVLAVRSASQDDLHRPFGGIVPEIASRNHTVHLLPLIETVLTETKLTPEHIFGIAVTNRPGLLGSLLVGLVTAKTLALTWKKPFIGVHHLEGHIVAPFLSDDKYTPDIFWNNPFLALVVSGGHTAFYLVNKFGDYKVVGETIDDAAGEAFDKFAKMLGLGYPGGAIIDSLSQNQPTDQFQFPVAMKTEDNLSFSGLKTAAQVALSKMSEEQIKQSTPTLCASYQEAIVEALILKLDRFLEKFKIRQFVITGGVSANSRLRERAQTFATKKNYGMLVPPLRYCTDNAAMIGYVGLKRLLNNEFSEASIGAFARSDLGYLDHA